jgi:hypothetical protein
MNVISACRHRARIGLLGAALALALAACDTQTTNPTPAATAVAVPTATAVAATVPAATDTPIVVSTLAPTLAPTTAPTAPPTQAPPTATTAPPPPTATSAAAQPTAPVQTGSGGIGNDLPYPEDGHIKGELVGERGPAGVCTGDALRQAAGPHFEVATAKGVTVNGQQGRIVLLGEQMLDAQGTPIASVPDYGRVRWYLVGPDCATAGAFSLPPRNQYNEWPPEVSVAKIHAGTDEQIVISSGTGAHWSSANLYSFDAQRGVWRNDGEVDGDASAGFGKPDDYGIPATDVAFRAYRLYDRAQLRHVDLLVWNPATRAYEPSETHIDFNFGPPETPAMPEDAVLLYYQAINAKDYTRAYNYLGPQMQQQLPFDQFKAGFAKTVRVWVSSLEPVGDSTPLEKLPDGTYTDRVEITSEDQGANGARVQQTFAGTWTVRVTNGVARLESAQIKAK